jgi:hypothetical protein
MNESITEVLAAEILTPIKKGGRPKGSKNKQPRKDKGIKRGSYKKVVTNEPSGTTG